jgi:hypothetical protein
VDERLYASKMDGVSVELLGGLANHDQRHDFILIGATPGVRLG